MDVKQIYITIWMIAMLVIMLFMMAACTVNLNITVTVGSQDGIEADADPVQDISADVKIPCI
jgi:hypothetical protein|uniref:Uncharacterized protein n=1 Tax=uncultured Caudovirales phage TaxID=2100421 RepID=A0A6J5KYE7_9CAUD|nr:hypothetical protein UFOVP88_4 [uncultured Caudovirales phage]